MPTLSNGLPYLYNGIEHIGDLGLDINTAFYRTLDPALGRWWQIDPKAEALKSLSPYNAMNNNPVSFNDPKGDLSPIFAGMLMGAVIDIGTQLITTGKVNWGNVVVSALAGAIGGAVSSGVGTALLGKGFSGFGAFLAGGSPQLATGVSAGLLSGAAGGFTGGFLSGSINAWRGGASFSASIKVGLNAGAWAGLTGSVIGGITGGIDAYRKGYDDIWNARKKSGVPITYTTNNELATQGEEEALCTFKSFENQEPMVGRPYDYDGAIKNTPMELKDGKVIGCDPRVAAMKGGYSVTPDVTNASDFDFKIKSLMDSKKPFTLSYQTGPGVGHMVSPYQYQAWTTQTGKSIIQLSVWDPNQGIRTLSRGTYSLWLIK